jgi:molybdate/tungstate transport system ATP-binding protein
MIQLNKLRIDLPRFSIQDIDLSIEKGEFFTLLGPTGAGKTLVLEAIMGLAPVSSGQIIVAGKDVTHLPPEKRGMGIVYQDYALFPHLTVLKNITYGLHYRKIDEQPTQKNLDRLIDQLNLSHLVDRSIHNLSGGEKQRVSLARALAVNPSVLLLDEPLSALDPNFREDIRQVLKKLHQELRITFLMVTHDFAEALFLGERMAIINLGKIEQIDPVSRVFQRPATPFVADFVGMKNIFPATFNKNRAIVDNLELCLQAPPEGRKRYVGIRAEDVSISKLRPSNNGLNVFKGRVSDIIDRGLYYEISVSTEEVVFRAMLTKSALFEIDPSETKGIYIAIPSSAIHVF